VRVTAESGNFMNYTITTKDISTNPSKPPLDATAPWLIFPESTHSVWVNDGRDGVTLINIHGSAAKFTSSRVVPEILHNAPIAAMKRSAAPQL